MFEYKCEKRECCYAILSLFLRYFVLTSWFFCSFIISSKEEVYQWEFGFKFSGKDNCGRMKKNQYQRQSSKWRERTLFLSWLFKSPLRACFRSLSNVINIIIVITIIAKTSTCTVTFWSKLCRKLYSLMSSSNTGPYKKYIKILVNVVNVWMRLLTSPLPSVLLSCYWKMLKGGWMSFNP